MRWSKLKQSIESFFCEGLQGRVELHNTGYHRVPFRYGRAWITVDAKEIYDFNDFVHERAGPHFRDDLRQVNESALNGGAQDKELLDEIDRVAMIAAKGTGFQSKYDFEDDLYEYLRTPVREALESHNIVHQSLAIIDRRIGKRTLKQEWLANISHPLFQRLFALRCEVEGIKRGKGQPHNPALKPTEGAVRENNARTQ